eukprot:749933-Hanusia_phi.AAC.4
MRETLTWAIADYHQTPSRWGTQQASVPVSKGSPMGVVICLLGWVLNRQEGVYVRGYSSFLTGLKSSTLASDTSRKTHVAGTLPTIISIPLPQTNWKAFLPGSR